MPITINGIGSHYYGKRNVESRTAECRACGNTGNLISYDTRLWIVFVYIPLIPLGRKRIIDQCPFCGRHYAVNAREWEVQKQLGISGAVYAYETRPTPESAMELHGTMINFLQTGQAATFRQEMIEKFGGSARIHAYLGDVLLQLGRQDESTKHFTRALELRPDLPEARVGVARQYLRELKYDQAREALDFLEKPGAEHLYSLSPLEDLANAYRTARKFRPALEIYQRLLVAWPAIGQIPSFRDTVRACEAALQEEKSILPKREKEPVRRRIPWGTLAVAGITVLLISTLFAVRNEYTRRNRTLYVVNGTNADASVVLRRPGGEQTVQVAGVKGPQSRPGVQKIVLPEGNYRVVGAGGPGGEFSLDLGTSYWERLMGRPFWLINVEGAALLVENAVTYRKGETRLVQSLHFGQEHEFNGRVAYPFTPLPEAVTLKSDEAQTLWQLDFTPNTPLEWVRKLTLERRSSEAMDLAEWALQRNPTDDMLQAYLEAIAKQQATGRADRLLKTGLARRPVSVPWHRAYQNLHQKAGEEAGLIAEYDRFLQADSGNADLLYLRGRLGAYGKPWFEQALKADPQHAYASFALGFNLLAEANFAAARPLLARGVEGVPNSGLFGEALWVCRLALGETAAMENETRESLKEAGMNMEATIRLIDLLVLQGRNTEAMDVVSDFERKTARMVRQDAERAVAEVRRHVLYAKGDFAGLEKDVSPDAQQPELSPVVPEVFQSQGFGLEDSRAREAASLLLNEKQQRDRRDAIDRVLKRKRPPDLSPAGQTALYWALFEQGRLDEALKLRPLSSMKDDDSFLCLVVSLALQKKGDTLAAAVWFNRGLELFEVDGGEAGEMARLLRAESAPDMKDVTTLAVEPGGKVLFLAVLAQKHPALRAELHRLARAMPVTPAFPYHFVRRTIASDK
jgi:tetratricopeptide (TPR) repeat protein